MLSCQSSINFMQTNIHLYKAMKCSYSHHLMMKSIIILSIFLIVYVLNSESFLLSKKNDTSGHTKAPKKGWMTIVNSFVLFHFRFFLFRKMHDCKGKRKKSYWRYYPCT